MKFRILVTTFVALMMSFYGTQVLAGRGGNGNGGKDNTVDVCHNTGNSDDYAFLISVPGNATSGHLAHGDFLAIDGGCGNEPERPDADQLNSSGVCEGWGCFWYNNECNQLPPGGPE
jgi:hypothetical protein